MTCASSFSTKALQVFILLGLVRTYTFTVSFLLLRCPVTLEVDESPRYWMIKGPVSLLLGKKQTFLMKHFNAPPLQSGCKNNFFFNQWISPRQACRSLINPPMSISPPILRPLPIIISEDVAAHGPKWQPTHALIVSAQQFMRLCCC